jgi:DHA2 family multidrug resistance protein
MSAKGEAQEPVWRPAHNPWAIAMIVTLAAFMEVLDSTIVNVSLPHISGSLSVGTDESTWTLTSYLVANGIVLPLSGWLSATFGRKRFFLICVIAFTIFSLLCGLATSLPELIVFRLLQGFFGGGLQPTQQSILLDSFPKEKRAAVFAVTAIAIVIAPVLGPTLGGYITDNFSWRWVFFLNVPVGLFVWFGSVALLEDPPSAKRQSGVPRVDGIGIGLIALGLGCLQIVLDKGTTEDWFESPFIRGMTFLTVLGIAGAIAWLMTRRNPIVNLRLYRDRNFALGNLLIFTMAGILYGSAVLLPQFAQLRLNYTSTWAGLILSPGAIATMAMLPLVVRGLLPRVQTRLLIGIGFALLGGGLIATGFNTTLDVNFGTLVLMRTLQTVGLAFLFVPISIVTFSTLPREDNSAGAALYAMSRNIGGSAGISLITAYVASRSQAQWGRLIDHLTPFDGGFNDALARLTQSAVNQGTVLANAATQANGSLYQSLLAQSSLLGYRDAFFWSGVLCLSGVVLAMMLKRTAAPVSASIGGH